MTPKTNREKANKVLSIRPWYSFTEAEKFILFTAAFTEAQLYPDSWERLEDLYHRVKGTEESEECPKKGPEEPEQRETDYLKHGGAICPYCESNDIEAGHMEWTSSGSAFQEVNCNGCGKEWKDLYNLTSVEFED